MLTKEEMIIIAEKYVKHQEIDSEFKFILVHEDTIKKPYGYIFSYDSKEHYETKDPKLVVLGCAPFLVENKTGRVIVFGTYDTLDNYLKEYENGTYVPASDGIWEVPKE